MCISFDTDCIFPGPFCGGLVLHCIAEHVKLGNYMNTSPAATTAAPPAVTTTAGQDNSTAVTKKDDAKTMPGKYLCHVVHLLY